MALRKFVPPAASQLWMPRERLMRKLTQAAGQGLVFVSAPGGSGKTVAMSQWMARQRNKVAWLSLLRHDNDPGNFYGGILGAMAHARKASRKLPILAGKAATAHAPLEFFIKAMSALPDNEKVYYLVLDDFQEIDNPEILDEMPRLLHFLPRNFVLFLLSRDEAPAGLADMIAKNEVAVLPQADLRFTPEEVGRLARLRNGELTEDAAASLCCAANGWAMGIDARLFRRDGESDFSGEQGAYFKGYLERHIWLHWNEETRAVLMRCALTPEISPDFCAHMTDNALSSRECLEILQRLERSSAFISRTGSERYRLHDLFREWLFEKYASQGQSVRAATLRAARWFREREEYFQAIDLYIQCGEFTEIGPVIEEMSRYDMQLSVEWHLHLMQSLVRHNLPRQVVAQNPHLLALYARGNFLEGNGRAFAAYADILRDTLDTTGKGNAGDIEASSFVCSLDFRVPIIEHAMNLRGRMRGVLPCSKISCADTEKLAQVNSITQNFPLAHRSMRDFSELVLSREQGFSLLKETYGGLIGAEYAVFEDCLQAGLYYERHELEKATALARRAYIASEKCRSPEFYVNARAIMYLLCLSKNAHGDANKIANEVNEHLQRNNFDFLRPNFLSLLYASSISIGDKKAAEDWLARHATGITGTALPFYKFPQHVTSARALLAVKNFHFAVLFLSRLRTMAENYHRPLDILEIDILRSQAMWKLEESWAALETLKGALEFGKTYGYVGIFAREGKALAPMLRILLADSGSPEWLRGMIAKVIAASRADLPADFFVSRSLSSRRQSLLRHLEQNLSNQEIAAVMEISPNTVKTHLKGIFHSLGVSSRREAVAVARTLNFVDA